MADPAVRATGWSDEILWYDCPDRHQDTGTSATSSSSPLLQFDDRYDNLDEARYASKVTLGPDNTLDHLSGGPVQRCVELHDGPEYAQPPWEAYPKFDSQINDSEGWSPKPSVQHLPSSQLQIAKLPMPAPANELSFMGWYPKGEASISFHMDDSRVDSISGINMWIIESRCPLLAAAFEESRSGPQLFLETLSPATAARFVRFLYTGSYATAEFGGDDFEDVPTSVLLHCSMFHLGDLYDIDDLKTQAYVNVLRQCEFGCSSPNQPIDLCSAIRYVYEHLRKHDNLIDAILHYCISCFLQHRLAKDQAFRKLAYELRPFHQDLCSKIRDQGFENDTAAAIIQLPFETYTSQMMFDDSPTLNRVASAPEPQISHARPADSMHGGNWDEEEDSPSKKRKRREIPTVAPMAVPDSNEFDLPLRLMPKEEEASEDVPEQEAVTQLAKKRRASTAEHERTEEADADIWLALSNESAPGRTPTAANGTQIDSPSWYTVELEDSPGHVDWRSPAGQQPGDDRGKAESHGPDESSDSEFVLVENASTTDTPTSASEWAWPDPRSEADHATNGTTDREIPIRLRERADSTGDVAGFVSESESDDWSLV